MQRMVERQPVSAKYHGDNRRGSDMSAGRHHPPEKQVDAAIAGKRAEHQLEHATDKAGKIDRVQSDTEQNTGKIGIRPKGYFHQDPNRHHAKKGGGSPAERGV